MDAADHQSEILRPDRPPEEIALAAVAADGAKLVIAGRRKSKVDDAVEALRGMGYQAVGMACDVSDLAQVEALADFAWKSWGRADVINIDAVYDSTETLDGLETYKYHVVVDEESAEVVDGVQGVYSQDKYLYIDPVTGAIIKQTQHEVRELEDGSTLLDMNLAFTDDQVSANATDAKDNGSLLGLLTNTLPLWGVQPLLIKVECTYQQLNAIP